MTTEGQAIRKMEGSETLMHRYEIVWSPEGRVVRTVWAASPKEAKRMTPRPYRQYMGEVYVQEAQ